MISILIVICNHVYCKAFDHANISKAFKNLFIINLFASFCIYWCRDVRGSRDLLI